ncbi:NADH dehydrogenase [ubiquinone] iron-sulfur protein 5-A [Platanthera zijinensis]
MDFSECMSHCREPKDCALLREDYLECLHHAKEVSGLPQSLTLTLNPNKLLIPCNSITPLAASPIHFISLLYWGILRNLVLFAMREENVRVRPNWILVLCMVGDRRRE